MQLMTFNSLLMFDVVFVFFLFLVGVTCLVYYLPPTTKKSTRRSKQQQSTIDHSLAGVDLECGGGSREIHGESSGRGGVNSGDEEESGDIEDSLHYYRQFASLRHHRCPHHHHHYHQQQLNYDQQLHSHRHQFMDNHYLPVMSSSPSSCSSSGGGGGGHSSRSYMRIPSSPTPTPPPPPPPSQNGTNCVFTEEDTEDQGNMEILPEHQPQQRHRTSRHLYHNILNSAFEQHGDPYGDDDEDELNMIATNVEILSSPIVAGIEATAAAAVAISTSLPASPNHDKNSPQQEGERKWLNGGRWEDHHRHRGQLMALMNSSNRSSGSSSSSQQSNSGNQEKQNVANDGNRYHLPLHPRPECHTARHVVGICQYHMQQHLKNHQQQHQLHRLYQQQQLLQQFANQQQQHVITGSSSSSTVSPVLSPTSGGGSLALMMPSIVQNPTAVDEIGLGLEHGQKKVQYIVVDTTTDRNKKPRPNQYCHVKAQNCDTVSRKCAAAGPVDEV